MRNRNQTVAYIILMLACLHPAIGTAEALAGGILFSLLVGNPWPARTAVWSKTLLQGSVVGLGFGLSLAAIWRVGLHSAGYTMVGIVATLAIGMLLGRFIGTTGPLSTLISFGTAICGGSAIAAMAPVIKARNEEIAVALATVFSLNAVALFIFPLLGHLLGLSQDVFGLWAGLAIHDTSSVVGAASAFGGTALAVGTTVKLTRALWIMPCVFMTAAFRRSEQKVQLPLFIIGFVAAAAIRTALPQFQSAWGALAAIARQLLVVTLFLIGSGLTKSVFKQVGIRPLAQGIILWATVSTLTLAAILSGFIPKP